MKVWYLAKKLEEHGIIVVASFLSPYEESREFVKRLVGNYYEVYISTNAEVCAGRDSKGVYQKALKGEITNFPGINAQYEIPENPMIEIDTKYISNQEAAKIIFNKVLKLL